MNLSSKIIFFTFFVFFLLQNISCKKGIFKRFDERYKYIGKYQVHKTVNSYGFSECGEPFSSEIDTIISVKFGETDSTLNVLDREVFLDSHGRYGGYHYWLRLWNDSIYSTWMNGGLGCGQYVNYTGVKISQKP